MMGVGNEKIEGGKKKPQPAREVPHCCCFAEISSSLAASVIQFLNVNLSLDIATDTVSTEGGMWVASPS